MAATAHEHDVLLNKGPIVSPDMDLDWLHWIGAKQQIDGELDNLNGDIDRLADLYGHIRYHTAFSSHHDQDSTAARRLGDDIAARLLRTKGNVDSLAIGVERGTRRGQLMLSCQQAEMQRLGQVAQRFQACQRSYLSSN